MPLEDIKQKLERNPRDHDGTRIQSSYKDSKSSLKLAYIESYGCQMNFADSEVVASILGKEGYGITESIHDASLVLINTCSIREKAEQTVRKRLEYFNSVKKRI